MPNLNKVMLMGNLTRDPEVSFLPSQTAICKFGLATNRKWTSQDGQQKEEVTFVDCTAFGKVGELLGKYLKKGRPVYVEGRLKLDQWEAQDGAKKSKLHVIVETFQFIDSRPGGGEGGGAPAPEGGYAPRPARQPMRPAATPQPVAQQAQPAAYEADAVPQYDEAPPIKEEDIPF